MVLMHRGIKIRVTYCNAHPRYTTEGHAALQTLDSYDLDACFEKLSSREDEEW